MSRSWRVGFALLVLMLGVVWLTHSLVNHQGVYGLGLVVSAAFALLRTAFTPPDRNQLWSPGAERDPREGGKPQIAGMPCVHCARKIFVVLDGESCAACQQPMHTSCAGGHRALVHQPGDQPYR